MTTTFEGLPVRVKPEVSARDLSSIQNERTAGMQQDGLNATAEPYVGVTEHGKITPGLFPVQPTGISTAPIKVAAAAFLASLSEAQRAEAVFPVESESWRRWSNVHMYLMRHGVSLEQMTEAQREKAFDLMRATLSKSGFDTSVGIMRLNETIREITGRNLEFSDLLYWFSVMGTPSDTEPWGWQVDGHHLILNCFVMGDQVVLSPQFLGSEPVIATAGKYAGTRVFDEEQDKALELMQALDASQQAKAIVGTEMPREVIVGAFRDNYDIERVGARLDAFSAGQRELASSLIETYVRRLRPGHDDVWMADVTRHLDETYFSWIGETGDEAVFYYRIHSPVILIEFDHQPGVALDFNMATRHHIHSIVRIPNGNDYGKDLLRQHYESQPHSVK
jgi:uncharacterized protein YbjQ (UPF0145 family)